MNTEAIKPDLMVHAKGLGSMRGTRGVHVGTVDHIDGQWIKLKRSDSEDGRHHWIPINWVERADNDCVYLNKSENEFWEGLVNEDPEYEH